MTDKVEKVLRGLPLRAVPPSLDARVLRVRRRRRRARRAAAAALAVAACGAALAVILWWPPRADERPAPEPAVARKAEPITIDASWATVVYEGTVPLADGPPLRAYRVRTVHHTEGTDPEKGLSWRLTTPKEEVVFVTADMQ